MSTNTPPTSTDQDAAMRSEKSTMVDGDRPLEVGDFSFHSRLLLGTGKYQDLETMKAALDASGTECVTVAIRRVDLTGTEGSILDAINTSRITLLPNTAGCFNTEDALRTARLARDALETDLIKLEVLADSTTLLPDPIETLKASATLVAEGFTVMAYTSDDPVIARRLEDIGCAAVMPLGSAIGSGLGILNPRNIERICDQAQRPIIVDAGVGTASDVTLAMELGVDGVLLNTGVALADDPVQMARAMRHGWMAGREAFLAGRMPKQKTASASSPVSGMITDSTGPTAGETSAP